MICHINCINISEGKQLHQKLAQLLDFPDWYGYNLDALLDCITELPAPTRLYLSSWDHTAPWTAGFEAVLTDAQESSPELTVVYE